MGRRDRDDRPSESNRRSAGVCSAHFSNLRLIEVQLDRGKLHILDRHGVDEPDALVGERANMAKSRHSFSSTHSSDYE